MIGTAAFVLAFIFIGLTVVAVAMRSGRSARRKSESPGARRAWTTGLLVASLLIGIAIPLWVIIANNDSKAKQAPGGLELNQAQVDGRQIFATRCANCHTLAASNAVGKVGPNLDNLRPPKALILDAIKNGRARGQGQMPAGVVDGQDAQNVASYVSAVAGRAQPQQ